MIKNWIHFNESNSDTSKIGWDEALEIIFYFNNLSCDQSESLLDELDTLGVRTWLDLIELDYVDVIESCKVLISRCSKDNSLNESMINIYQSIREERRNFPEMGTLWDICVELADESDFGFVVECSDDKYVIKFLLWKKSTPEKFFKYCKILNDILERIRAFHKNSFISNLKFSNNFREDGSEYGYSELAIQLMK